MVIDADGCVVTDLPVDMIKAAQVWTNADPAVAFADQTVTLSEDKNAILYAVTYRMRCSNTGSYKTEIVAPQKNTVLGCNYFNETKFEPVTRNVVISGTSADFSSGCVDGDQSDEYVVPVAIYAIYH